MHHFLGRHPEIFICPVNEPNFFAVRDGGLPRAGPGMEWLERRSLCDEGAYRRSFDGAKGERAIGEVSPRYMATPGTAERIASVLPEVKLVAILRQPAERAFSSFVSLRRDGIEPLADLRLAIRDEPRRLAEGWGLGRYTETGRYAQHLEPYFEHFPRDHIRVYLHDDLQEDPRGLFADLFEFLGVSRDVELGDLPRLNPTGEIRNSLLGVAWRRTHWLRGKVGDFVPTRLRDPVFERIMGTTVKPEFPPELRAELTERFRPDIDRLQELLGRDLSHWL